MNPQIIIAAIIAAMGFAGGFGTAWKIQAGNINAKEAAYAKQILANVRDSAAADIRRLDNTITAQNRAAVRAIAVRRDSDSVRSELDRLRLAARSTVPSTCDAADAGIVRADPARELFLECSEQLTTLAGKVDRHVNDLRMMAEAWPKP